MVKVIGDVAYFLLPILSITARQHHIALMSVYLARASIFGVLMVVLPLKPTSPHPMSSTKRRRTFGKPEAALEEVKRRQRRAKSSSILKSAGLASFSAPA